MQEIKFKIESQLEAEYAWTLQVFGRYIGFKPVVVEANEDILIAEHGMSDIQVSHFFRSAFLSGDYQHQAYFRKQLLHHTASNKPDYLSTCFYLLAFVQEYTDYIPDKYGRFPYANSVQCRFECVERNLVAEYFDAIYENTPKLKTMLVKMEHPTRVFLSHDIDSIYGALAQNGKWYLKHGKISSLIQLIFNHYLRTPDYLLLNKIMDIEDAHDVRSVFFWLTQSGRGTRSIQNADYVVSDGKVANMQSQITKRGWINGMHKSAGKTSYKTDWDSISKIAEPVNRNHYLLTELPGTFNDLEAAGMQMDATMGFPEVPGFRNSYGLPLQPFHMKEKRSYRFVEVPLHVMDTTYRYYQQKSGEQATRDIIQFLENNKRNAVISILWHNNYFFDATDTSWLKGYKEILQYMRDAELSAIMPAEIIAQYAD